MVLFHGNDSDSTVWQILPEFLAQYVANFLTVASPLRGVADARQRVLHVLVVTPLSDLLDALGLLTLILLDTSSILSRISPLRGTIDADMIR